MRVEEFVGQRVRARREELGITQEEFGRKLGPLLGKPWSRQTVSAAEQGGRAWTAAELIAVASVLQTRAPRLLTPPVEIGEVTMPGGAALSTREVAPDIGVADPYLSAMWDELARVIEDLEWTSRSSGHALAVAKGMQDQLTTAIAAAEVATMHKDRASKENPLPSVAAAIVTSARGVLVARRNDGKPPWTFIAGEVEPGETAPFAAGREVKEETGLEVSPGKVIGERVHPKTGRTMIYVAAKPVRPDDLDVFVGDTTELAEVRWVSLAEADELLPGMFEPVREHLGREIGQG